MSRLVCDLESNGLLDTVDMIHCLVTKDVDTAEVKQYHNSAEFPSDGTIEDGLKVLEEADHIVFHNYIGYDRKVIKKLYPEWKEPSSWDDTLILSQILYANVVKNHSIAEWGRVFKRSKPGHEDWSKLSEDMLHRCREDTHIGYTLFQRCERSRSKYNIEKAIKLEYKVYEIDCEHEYWYINEKRLDHFIKRLGTLREMLRLRVIETAPHQPVQSGTFKTLFKKNGETLLNVVKYADKCNIGIDTIQGPFSKVEFKELNPGSSAQVSEWLLGIGWKPELFNYKRDPVTGKPMKDKKGKLVVSTPKFGGEFRGIPEELQQLLVKFNKVSKRLGTLEGYKERQTDGRMPLSALTCGCVTGRYKHRGITNVPKANGRVYLGKMMRSLFTSKPGYTMVGCDASGLEARIIGHYTTKYDGGLIATALLDGDLHTKNAVKWSTDRDTAKMAYFALAYQAGIGRLLGILDTMPEAVAKEALDAFWVENEGLAALRDALVASVESRGYSRRNDLYNTRAYITTIDGRPIFVRKWFSVVNSLIQSTATIVVKVALCYAYDAIRREKLDARLAIVYHDEINYISHPKDAAKVKEILQESMTKGGEYFGLNVPIDSEAKIGNTWGAIH